MSNGDLPPIPPPTFTNIDPLIVPTTGNVWVLMQGTNFFVKNSVLDLTLQGVGYGAQSATGPYSPSAGFEWYVQSDTDVWILAPPVTSFTGLPGFDQPELYKDYPYPIQIQITTLKNTMLPPPGTGTNNVWFTPDNLFFRYHYLPVMASVDVGSPVLWTGQSVDGTVTLSVPAGSQLDVTLSTSVPGVTFDPETVQITTGTTGNFQITVPADATPGPVSITASLPGGSSASTTAQISAGQIFLVPQGTYLTNPAGEETGSFTAGTPVVCTFYVRTEVSGVRGGVSIDVDTFPPFPQTGWLPAPQSFLFTAPTPAKLHLTSFHLTATYPPGENSTTFGPYTVAAPIKIPPIHGGPTPV